MSTEQRANSIIIPTYNRARFLSKTLDSVCNQTTLYNNYEILIIDDGSTDNTKEIIADFQKQHPEYDIKYFYQKNAGPSKARNLGIKESKGEIIFFTDDDCIVPPDWMATLLDGYARHPEVVGVGGGYKSFNEAFKNRYFQKYIDKYSGFVNKLDNRGNKHMFKVENKTNVFGFNSAGNTANMSYKKEILEKIGGFDENLYFPGAVDLELKNNIQRRGYYLLYVPLLVNHLKIFNFTNFFKRSFNQGRGRYYMSLKYPELPSYYDFSFFNFLKKLLFCGYGDMVFFPAYFISSFALFIGRCHAKYIKPFKNVGYVERLNDLNTKIFSVEKKDVKDNAVFITKFSKFNKVMNDRIQFNGGFLSVIIPTYNRSRGITDALSHLVAQTIPRDNYEIIVVDDGSTDNTKEIIADFQKQHPEYDIKYFYQKNAGPSKARNLGIKESKGEIIFFTDDDCTVPPDWMATLLDGYARHPEVVGVGGWHMPPDGELEISATSRYDHYVSFYSNSFKRSLTFYEVLTNNPTMFFGTFAYNTANICYKKEILQKVGGFNEDFYWPGGEDNDLAFRIAQAGHHLLYIPFNVIHPKAMSLPEFTKLHFCRGANGYLLRTIHGDILEKQNPGLIKNYGSAEYFIKHLNGPEKFLAFLEWLSLNAGILYMKQILKRRIVAGETRIRDHF